MTKMIILFGSAFNHIFNAKIIFVGGLITEKNSINVFFHLLQASDKFSRSNLNGLGVGNLFIIGELVSDVEEKNEKQNSID